jgi:hypothetical protein
MWEQQQLEMRQKELAIGTFESEMAGADPKGPFSRLKSPSMTCAWKSTLKDAWTRWVATSTPQLLLMMEAAILKPVMVAPARLRAITPLAQPWTMDLANT